VSLIIGTIINGTLSLIPSYNPVTILGTGGVKATATGADAIDGASGVGWKITNSGTVSSTSGYGVNLAGLGVSSRTLMGHPCRMIRRVRYGTDSTRERHNDRGGPSSDTT
jgi:hypothetical protein